jgi:hypothetical protein
MKRASLIFLSVFVVFSLACGLLEDEATNISYTEQIPLDFPIDADALCPTGTDCTASSTPAPVATPLLPIELAADIDVVELTGNEELRKFTGAFRSIEITGIDYEVRGNDLTFDLPPVKLYLGPHGSDSADDEGVVLLTTIPEVPAGENKSGSAPVSDAGRSASSDLLQDLKLSAVIFAEPVVEEGQPLPPSGSADMDLDINVKFTVNPQDAL